MSGGIESLLDKQLNTQSFMQNGGPFSVSSLTNAVQKSASLSDEQASAFEQSLAGAMMAKGDGVPTRQQIGDALHASNQVAQTDNDDATKNLSHDEFMSQLDSLEQSSKEPQITVVDTQKTP
jgi:hypothetical protein